MSIIITRLQSTTLDNQSMTMIPGDERLTFSQFWSETDAFAGGLRERDIADDDGVAIRLSDPRSFLVAVYGTLRNGSVPVTVPTTYETQDVVHVLNETASKAFVTDDGRLMPILNRASELRVAVTVDRDARIGVELPAFLDNDGISGSGSRTDGHIASRSDDDRGLISYVGRYERDPLAVSYTHSSLAAAADLGSSILDEGGRITHLGVLPLSNPIALVYGATATILDGGQYRPVPTRDPEGIRSALHHRDVDRTFVTPRQYDAVQAHGIDDTDAVFVVESPMAASDPERSKDLDGVSRLRALPETGITHVSTADADDRSIGESVPGVTATILETPDGVDELAISGPQTAAEYVERPGLTADTMEPRNQIRWVRTGIPARLSDGTITIADGEAGADPIRQPVTTPHSETELSSEPTR